MDMPKLTFRTRRVLIASVGGFVMVAGIYLGTWWMRQDTYCYQVHKTSSTPPPSLTTSRDWFDQANYDYDSGKCAKAVVEYGFAIGKDPKFAEAYNNRAYTYMRMQNYLMALPDLDTAIELRPDYAHARANREYIQKHTKYN